MTHPENITPANPAQGVSEAMVEAACDAAYRVLNAREGVIFTGIEKRPVPPAIQEWMRAALTAAIGAGGQAVALPPITERGLQGQIMDAAWPEFGGNMQTAEFWNDFGAGVEFTLKAIAHPVQPGWRDMDSAPKDGTKFDVWVPDAFGGHRMTGLSFNHKGGLRQNGLLTEAELPRWPTHWMPIPAAPQPKGE